MGLYFRHGNSTGSHASDTGGKNRGFHHCRGDGRHMTDGRFHSDTRIWQETGRLLQQTLTNMPGITPAMAIS